LKLASESQRESDTEPVQLLEGVEYRYTISTDLAGDVAIDPREMFWPDKAGGRAGRLRPGLHVGGVTINIRLDGIDLGVARFEVRARKLHYLREYRWMLRDLAEMIAEVVMHRFAPAEQRFRIDPTRNAATLYQQFAFMRSTIFGDLFDSATGQILARPHRQWMEEAEHRPIGGNVRPSSGLIRQLTSGGQRTPTSIAGPLQSLPVRVMVQRQEETLDTPENRFIKFALTHWRGFLYDMRQTLAAGAPEAPKERGVREIDLVIGRLDGLLSAEMFSDVGRMTRLPADSQVLQKRGGYREVFRLWVQFELAASVTWSAGDDVFRAGQRNVATLYEYWAYMQVVKLIYQVSGRPIDLSALVDVKPGSMNLKLNRGSSSPPVQVELERLGRKLRIELYFNRRFGITGHEPEAWTRSMTPDCSLAIYVPAVDGSVKELVWVHFDAKYRADNPGDLFGRKPVTEHDEEADDRTRDEEEVRGTVLRADLLKMHAYRDAVRRSIGAYVLYPGSDSEASSLYHEILPGLGAFALRPTSSGDVKGGGELRQFLESAIIHVASQATQHERVRYWVHEATDSSRYPADPKVEAAAFLTRPPADTTVLVGFVRNRWHLEWINATGRYNLRGDGDRPGSVRQWNEEMNAEFVVLWGYFMRQAEIRRVSGPPEVWNQVRMESTHYPSAAPGVFYFCLPMTEPIHSEWAERITQERIARLRRSVKPGESFATPYPISWLTLVND
jgi:uncharacterized protein